MTYNERIIVAIITMTLFFLLAYELKRLTRWMMKLSTRRFSTPEEKTRVLKGTSVVYALDYGGVPITYVGKVHHFDGLNVHISTKNRGLIVVNEAEVVFMETDL